MAYNNYNHSNREWDQGKGYGHEQQGGNSSRVHPREEDSNDYPAGTEKRRKHDNGAYNTNTESWSDDRYPRPGVQGTGHQQQMQQQNQNRRRLIPSEPSPHVIFLGLDPDHTEADLHGHLLSLGCVLDNVTIIRDRATGTWSFLFSSGFGFAQFSSTEHAKTFVSPRFPFISVPPPASHGATALQAYKIAVENGTAQHGRRVKIDFSQSAHPPERGGGRGRHQVNDGTRDIGNTQAPVVLLRGLDYSSSLDIIAQGLRASAGPGKEGAQGMRRLILVKDKYTGASWGFAFVEFVDVQSSSAFLADLMSSTLHPSGFRIAERPVAASFAHPYSFQPLGENMIRDESCVSSSLATGGVEDTWARYWDESATVEESCFEVEAPMPVLTMEKDPKAKKKKDPSKVVIAEEPVPAEASVLPVSDKPVTLNFKGGLSGTVATSSLGFSTENLDAPNVEDDPTMKGHSTESEKALTFKKVAPLIASRKVANNISKWNTVQEVLSNKAPSSGSVNSTLDVTISDVVTSATTSIKPPPTVIVQDEFEFADIKTLACLLCARKFKTMEQLGRHNKESDLHKARLLYLSLMFYRDRSDLDVNLRQIAAGKVQALKTPPPQPKYRDRASERRVLHNQPDVPLPEPSGSTSQKRTATPPAPPPPPPPPVHPGKDENNIGNKLLKKMGWAEGTGLGTGGEGRVEPIATAIYAQGVGLGASKGKEIGKYTEKYGSYVDAVRDLAKERYEGQ
ncbi:hypothetical protein BU17DRAFT_45113 [Hysterangium stoloniferum]|nr:hypothetical protein BU17DRAFT_45113 [Hysterangium stoloniferum]